MKDFQFITNAHPGYIENLYNDFVKDPGSVDVELRKFFEGYDFAVSETKPGSTPPAKQNGKIALPAGQLDKEFAVFKLIRSYRNKGHLIAKTNPIRERKNRHANLELSHFGLSDADLDTSFEAAQFISLEKTTLRNIVAHLQKAYTNHVGVEFSYLKNDEKVQWLKNAMEKHC